LEHGVGEVERAAGVVAPYVLIVPALGGLSGFLSSYSEITDRILSIGTTMAIPALTVS
jgi:hypothetical protein